MRGARPGGAPADGRAPRAAEESAPGLVWDWRAALRGATYAVPAVCVAPSNVPAALALAVGVLPAALAGTDPRRAARFRTVLFGVFAGVPLFLGALLAQVPWVAVLAVFVLSIGAAVLAAGRPFGKVALALCLPMLGVGLSYDDLRQAAGLAALLVAGSVYAYLVSLPWPQSDPVPAGPAATPPRRVMVGFGVRLGAAAATAAGIAFALDLEHVGWACAAALLVMRPSAQVELVRGFGRIVSVILGAALAVALVQVDASAVVVGLCAGVAVTAAAATVHSRWYVAGTFTTFVVFLLLLVPDPQDSQDRFVERVGETLLGVGLAVLFGVVVPYVWHHGPWPERAGPGSRSAR